MDKCEFYPTGEEPICDCGSDISGPFICTKQYSLKCQWAIEERINIKGLTWNDLATDKILK